MAKVFLTLAIFSYMTLLSHAQNQSDLTKACKTDLQKFCKGVRAGDSRLLQCLRTNVKLISTECSQMLGRMKQ
ncbi:MAG: hypothetical protein KF792_02335 [Chelatococcus sp.]|nr:hypothetical protein [Chelatococcus sp. YT9]MBX3555059.1 hypothetical protein [Chelatococcus sp.]